MLLTPFKAVDYNVTINKFLEFTEYIIHKDTKTYFTGNYGGINFNTGLIDIKCGGGAGRNFKLVDGVLVPIKDTASIENLEKSLNSSLHRTIDNFYGYALSNIWQYWVTLTFSSDKVNRNDDKQIQYVYKLFRQKMQYINSNVKILAVPERHKQGQLHLHCLISDIDLKPFLDRAVNPHTNKPIFSNGRAVYNLNLFEYGFSTLINVDSGCNTKLINYVLKYVVKDFGNVGYGKKRFWHTSNLNFRDRIYCCLSDLDLQEFTANNSNNFYKSCNNFDIYRVENKKN